MLITAVYFILANVQCYNKCPPRNHEDVSSMTASLMLYLNSLGDATHVAI